jgi:hypothetical protein
MSEVREAQVREERNKGMHQNRERGNGRKEKIEAHKGDQRE